MSRRKLNIVELEKDIRKLWTPDKPQEQGSLAPATGYQTKKYMKTKNNGGAAFPHTVYHPHPINDAMRGTEKEHDGMTLRDYFAAAALQGIFAGDNHLDEWESAHQMECWPLVAKNAYELADAMIAARDAKSDNDKPSEPPTNDMKQPATSRTTETANGGSLRRLVRRMRIRWVSLRLKWAKSALEEAKRQEARQRKWDIRDKEYRQEVAREAAKNWLPQCPWPESVWPMTEEEYVRAVPDPNLRTAISGFLMRRGWQIATDDMEQRMKSAPNE
jgi:hypothetical protein